MPTLSPASTVSFPLQVDQILTLTNNFASGSVTLSAQKSGDIVYSYTNEQMQDSPVFSPGSQGIVTINNLTGFLTYNVSTSAFPLYDSTPRVIAQSAIPFILSGGTGGGGTNQFTAGAAGAISTLPTLSTTYTGAWFYLPAGTFTGQAAAGWYWFVGSSTTAGTVYNNRYVSGDPKLAVPTTLVPFGAALVGLVTQTTASITAQTIIVPGGSMGPNGQMEIWASESMINNANFKSLQITFGGGILYEAGLGSTTSNGLVVRVSNRNSQAVNMFDRPNFTPGSIGNTSQPMAYRTVNTAVDQSVNFNLTIPASTDFIVLETSRTQIFYGA